jgi:hypothetical protein
MAKPDLKHLVLPGSENEIVTQNNMTFNSQLPRQKATGSAVYIFI